MNTNTELVFKGFLGLTNEEKNEFIREVNEYLNKNSGVQKSIRERMGERTDLGPLMTGGCPCCGR